MNILVLTPWTPNPMDWDTLFNTVEFWVQMHQAPAARIYIHGGARSKDLGLHPHCV